MPRIAYPGPHRAVVVLGIACPQGELIAFPAAVAAKLREQGWTTTPGTTPGTETTTTEGA